MGYSKTVYQKYSSSVKALLFFLIVVSFIAPAFADEVVSKEQVLKKYQSVVGLAEELNLYDQDILAILPKIRLASKALLREDFEQADRLLIDAQNDLHILQSQLPKQVSREFKLEWLEIYLEIFQKFSLLAILSFLFVKWGVFARILRTKGTFSFYPAFLMGVSSTVVGCLFSIFDLARYGESAWAFFDIQVVLITVTGVLGGWPAGMTAGILSAAFRHFLEPNYILYPAILLASGVSGAVLKSIPQISSLERKGIAAGIVSGLLHGLLIYLPSREWMAPFYFYFSISFLTFLEAAAVYIFAAIIVGILREEKTRENEKELLKSRLLFLQAQISPHFLFNALNTISVISGREGSLTAQKLILQLADFLRRILKREHDEVTLEDEISYIRSYLELERARFQDRLKVEEQLDLSESARKYKLPILILQPIVENAVKYAVAKKTDGGSIIFKAQSSFDVIMIEVTDDGPGIPPSEIAQILEGGYSSKESTGVGLKNIHQRLRRRYGNDYGLIIESGPDGKGTRIRVKFPIER